MFTTLAAIFLALQPTATEPRVGYLDSVTGDDLDSGFTAEEAVKTPERALTLIKQFGVRRLLVARGSAWTNRSFASQYGSMDLSGLEGAVLIEADGTGTAPRFTFTDAYQFPHCLRLDGDGPFPPLTFRGLAFENPRPQTATAGKTMLIVRPGYHGLTLDTMEFGGGVYGIGINGCKDATLRRVYVHDIYPPADRHADCHGIYGAANVRLWLDQCVVLRTGANPLYADSQWQRNQMAYLHGNNVGTKVTGCVFALGAHAGIQTRGNGPPTADDADPGFILDNVVLDVPWGIALGNNYDVGTLGNRPWTGECARNVVMHTDAHTPRIVNVGIGTEQSVAADIHDNFVLLGKGGPDLTAALYLGSTVNSPRVTSNVAHGWAGYGLNVEMATGGFIGENRLIGNTTALNLKQPNTMFATWDLNWYTTSDDAKGWVRVNHSAYGGAEMITTYTQDGHTTTTASRTWPPPAFWAGAPSLRAYGLSLGIGNLTSRTFAEAAARGDPWATPAELRKFVVGFYGE